MKIHYLVLAGAVAALGAEFTANQQGEFQTVVTPLKPPRKPAVVEFDLAMSKKFLEMRKNNADPEARRRAMAEVIEAHRATVFATSDVEEQRQAPNLEAPVIPIRNGETASEFLKRSNEYFRELSSWCKNSTPNLDAARKRHAEALADEKVTGLKTAMTQAAAELTVESADQAPNPQRELSTEEISQLPLQDRITETLRSVASQDRQNLGPEEVRRRLAPVVEMSNQLRASQERPTLAEEQQWLANRVAALEAELEEVNSN